MQQIRRMLSGWKVAILPGALALLAVLLVQLFGGGPLNRVGNLIFDSYIRAKPRPYRQTPVKIVDIDEESLRKLGQWPWPRAEISRLIQRLADAGAAVIALDVVFSEPDRTSPPRIAASMAQGEADPRLLAALRGLPDSDARFAEVIAQTPVVTGYFLTHDKPRMHAEPKAGIAISGSLPERAVPEYSNAILPLPELQAPASGTGFLSLEGDSDGIVRKAPLLAMQDGQLLPSLSLEALRVAQGAGAIIVKSNDGSGNMNMGGEAPGVVSVKVGQFEVPTTRAGQMWMHYTAPGPERAVPAWNILSGTLSPEQMAKTFGGQIVFIGTGAIGLRDLISTPVQDREMGVMVHAQAVEQMILGAFIVRPDWASGIERAALVLFGIILLLTLPRLGAIRGAINGLLLAGGALGGSWYAFDRYQFLLDPTYPVLGVLLVYLTQTVLTYYREERQRSYIHQAFDRYLSPELVRRIASDPRQLELGGEERQMTVLFCDIRSFSRLSEKLEPKAIIGFLIDFLTPMCDVLLSKKATIDKFIGDAILAFWNAPLDDPDQFENAARAALAMTTTLRQLNHDMLERGNPNWPSTVRIGIGLNAGSCCVGNMGSAQRLSYSLIGDTVNLASRIEGLTKLYGVEIAIGSSLQAEIAHFATLPIDRVRVVGRDNPEQIHALIGDDHYAQTPEFRRFAERHAAMLSAYRAQDWAQATQLIALGQPDAPRFGLDKLYALYAERVARLALDPPDAGWDGIFTASEK